MMVKPSVNQLLKIKGVDNRYTLVVTELLKRAANRYELVIATARRARQIAAGAEPKTNVKEESPVTLAVNEIAEGKVTKI